MDYIILLQNHINDYILMRKTPMGNNHINILRSITIYSVHQSREVHDIVQTCLHLQALYVHQ